MKFEYYEMRRRKDGEVVRVYDLNNGIATIFSESQYQRDGSGWQNVKITQLLPVEFPTNKQEYVSKTKRNRAKSHMKLVDAIWETTDGQQWKHDDIEDAIAHELYLMYGSEEVGEDDATNEAGCEKDNE